MRKTEVLPFRSVSMSTPCPHGRIELPPLERRIRNLAGVPSLPGLSWVHCPEGVLLSLRTCPMSP
jgi:hypothetical protein